jgi:Peptidase family M48
MVEVVSSKKCRSAMECNLCGTDNNLSRERCARGMHSSGPRFAPITFLALVFATSLVGTAAAAGAESETEDAEIQVKAQRVQDVVNDLAGRLSLKREVVAAIVPLNPLMVSVVSPANRDGAYRVAFDGAFLETLTDEELRAVVAHELGHVWIFTHHPYLQTEQLANKIALRVVPRETLERVYHKVWPHGTPLGAPARFPAAAN